MIPSDMKEIIIIILTLIVVKWVSEKKKKYENKEITFSQYLISIAPLIVLVVVMLGIIFVVSISRMH